MPLTRRTILTLAALSPLWLGAGRAAAEEILDLEWEDLIPQGGGGDGLDVLRELGVVQHEQLSSGFVQPESTGIVRDFDGKVVRLPGFIVPLKLGAEGVTEFILAPFVGACIHVPPPPANQLVFVTSDVPFESAGLFEPVHVTGMFGAAATGTQLAQIGYAISAESIVPFE